MARFWVWRWWTPLPLLSPLAAAAPPPPRGWRLHPECCCFILRPTENRWIRRDQQELLCFPSLNPPWNTCSQWPLLHWSEPTSTGFQSRLVLFYTTGLHLTAESSSVLLLTLPHPPAQQVLRLHPPAVYLSSELSWGSSSS